MPRRGPGRMVRTAGRTAVVAGTATAVTGRVRRRQAARAANEQQAAAPQPQPPPVADEQQGDDTYEQLRKLGELRDAGILTEEEFAVEKAQVLSTRR